MLNIQSGMNPLAIPDHSFGISQPQKRVPQKKRSKLWRKYFDLHHLNPHPDVELVYRRLESLLQGQLGQLILFINRELHPWEGCPRGRGGEAYDLNEHLELGLLAAENLVLEIPRGTISLPTHQYAAVTNPPTPKVTLKEGAICLTGQFRHYALYHKTRVPVNTSLPTYYDNLPMALYRSEVIIGNKAVREWFSRIQPICHKDPSFLCLFDSMSNILNCPL